MFISLAKGQEDLKTLILKEKKKKKKKKKKKLTGALNMGRRFGGPLKKPVDLTSSSKEAENQERQTREENLSPEVSDNDTDYNDEQYPPTKDRYNRVRRSFERYGSSENTWVRLWRTGIGVGSGHV